MTHDDDARIADLLARLGDGDAKELFRRLLEHGMQELIDAELTAAIGAAPHERTDARSNQRTGVRSRLLSTPAGDVELRIPKLRVGSFFPSLLEPRRRVDKALWGVITTGTSTRKIAAAGIASGRSPRMRGSRNTNGTPSRHTTAAGQPSSTPRSFAR